ncbi:hypothetical protein T484DRAFT_2423771 [Baffinella frigidus]|nr:hypothetical protein T484DRAFT_2423771 [Cryptophyta sp. CCMP2293]
MAIRMKKALQVAAALSASGLGILMALLLVSPPQAGRTGLMQQMLIPMRPPAMDHVTLGVGNEEVNEKTANWALKVLGGMNGTLIEALIANGTIAHPGEAVDAKLVAEIHQAQHEQDIESDPNAAMPEPFAFEEYQTEEDAAGADEEDGEAAEDSGYPGQEEADAEEDDSGADDEASEVKPCTLNPEPSTLNPQPSTLNPQPSTLNPQPSTLDPTPQTPNPESQTRNQDDAGADDETSEVKPCTLNPQPSTLDPQPSTLNPGPYTPNPKL